MTQTDSSNELVNNTDTQINNNIPVVSTRNYDFKVTNNSNWFQIQSLDGIRVTQWEFYHELCAEFSYKWKRAKFNRFMMTFDYEIKSLYLSTDNVFCVPSGFWLRLNNFFKKRDIKVKFECKRIDHIKPNKFVKDWETVEKEFTFRPGQKECLILLDKIDRGIINAPTGWGKTELMIMLCALYPKANIYIVTKSSNLANEIRQRLQSRFNCVGMIGRGKHEIYRINVVVAKSLHHVLATLDTEHAPDIVLGDEVDQLAAPTFVDNLAKLENCKMFGFSASVNVREDGRDKEVEAIFGPVVYKLEYNEVQQLGSIVPMQVIMINFKTYANLMGLTIGMDRKRYKDFRIIDRNLIWYNAKRNYLIADIANKLIEIDPDCQILIITKTLVHAINLGVLLPEFKICHATPINKSLMFKLRKSFRVNVFDNLVNSKGELEEVQAKFADGEIKRAISTYVWSAGVDFKHLNVVIRADGALSKTKSIQIPGRACRRVPGVKEQAILIDIFDRSIDTLLARSNIRKRQYIENGWDVKIVNSIEEISDIVKKFKSDGTNTSCIALTFSGEDSNKQGTHDASQQQPKQ